MLAGCRTYPYHTIRSHRVPQQPRRVGVADAMKDTLCGHSAPSEAQDTFSQVVTTKAADGSGPLVSCQNKNGEDRFDYFLTAAVLLFLQCWPCMASYAIMVNASLSIPLKRLDQYEMVQVERQNVSPLRMLAAASTQVGHTWYHTDRHEQHKRVTSSLL